MRSLGLVAILLTAACGKLERAPGAATADEARRRWNAAIASSDLKRAARMLAPGHKEDWLARTLVTLPVFGATFPELRELVERIKTDHDFTLDGLTLQSLGEESHLKAIRKRLDGVKDGDALFADVWVGLSSFARSVWAAYPPLANVERFESSKPSFEAVVRIDGRWYVVIPLASESETFGSPPVTPKVSAPDDG